MSTVRTRRKRRKDLLANYERRCFWCGCGTTRGGKTRATVDHMFPRSDARRIGGVAQPCVLACFRCNSKRGDTPFEIFAITMAGAHLAVNALVAA